MSNIETRIIQEAILNEVEGAQFYRMAAAQAPNAESKEALLKLAEEEDAHIEYLQRLAGEIASGEFTVDKVIAANLPSPDIYNWGRLEGASISLGLSVFSIGMQMERDSIAFYEDAKKKLSDEASKQVFDVLIRWEETHLEQFRAQYDLYKQQWWADQGYAPY